MEADRRRCIRLVTPDAREGMLGNGRKRFKVQILDESARGFGILVETDHIFCENEIWVLSTENGYSQVRVEHVKELPDGKRLGLERIRDVAGTAPKVKHSLKPVLQPITRSLLVLALIFGLSVLVAILGPILFNQHGARWRRLAPGLYIPPGSARDANSSHRAERPSDRRSDRRSSSSSKSAKKPQPGVMDKIGEAASSFLDATEGTGKQSADQASAAGEAAADAASKVTALTQKRLNDWRAELEKLPWEPSRLLALVTDELTKLELSPEQQEVVALLIARAVADLQAVAKSIGAGIDGTSIAKRLEASAIQEIVAVFTPPQREKWNQMTAASGAG